MPRAESRGEHTVAIGTLMLISGFTSVALMLEFATLCGPVAASTAVPMIAALCLLRGSIPKLLPAIVLIVLARSSAVAAR